MHLTPAAGYLGGAESGAPVQELVIYSWSRRWCTSPGFGYPKWCRRRCTNPKVDVYISGAAGGARGSSCTRQIAGALRCALAHNSSELLALLSGAQSAKPNNLDGAECFALDTGSGGAKDWTV